MCPVLELDDARMIDLGTRYLGLALRSPLVMSASPLCEHLDNLRRAEDAGAGAVAVVEDAGLAGGDAVLATLAWRLWSYWLPVPVGGIAYWVFRRRYPAGGPSAA